MAIVLAAGPASATGNAGIAGGVLTYTGGGENNSVTLSVSASQYTFTDFAAGSVVAGTGCTPSNGPAGPMPILNCTRNGVTAIVIDTGAGDDVAQVAVANEVPPGVTLTVKLGTGNDSWSGPNSAETVFGGAGRDSIDTRGGHDVVHGGDDADTVFGGAGDDELFGDGGDDTLSGQADADTVDGGTGNDRVDGNEGADTVRGGPNDDMVGGGLGPDRVEGGDGKDRLRDDERGQATPFRSPDVLIGGPGNDTADYSYRLSEATPLNLSLDGAANDGAAGEGDNIGPDGSVENIKGGIRNDVITGSSAANKLFGREGNDTINGRGGNDKIVGDSGNDTVNGAGGLDTVDGGFGRDTVTGGPGRDSLFGGADNDVIKARDGVAEPVNCGPGVDRAEVDRGDSVSVLCETVIR
ncbi:MAG: hypothetical protein H6518_02240 [Microthrixaceae bacterium]|nr:hypothetical protein [Microthrixaceae bacterium]